MNWMRQPSRQGIALFSARMEFWRSPLYLIGDAHGRVPEYLRLLATLPPGSRSIAVGDLYLGRPGVHLPELPPEHKFLRGNHDDPALCRKHPNYLGDYGYLPDDDLFFVSGALTASWRVLGNSKYWYKDEELSDLDLNEAIGLYKDTRPKLVISHTAPSEGSKEILKDLNGSYFLNKHGIANVIVVAKNVRGVSAVRLVA
jgi:hypothetical protein